MGHPFWTVLQAAVIVALVMLGAATLCRLVGLEPGPLTWMISLTPWIGLASVLTLVLAVVARSMVLVAVASVIVVLQVAFQLPLFLADSAPGDRQLTVMTANLMFGRADADTIVSLVQQYDVDILAVQELTPASMGALRTAGLETLLPSSATRYSGGATGTGLWSRFALSDERALEGFTFEQVLARADTPLGTMTLGSLHPAVSSPPHWEDERSRLADQLEQVEGPMLIAGDLNATWDNASFRTLLAHGFVDAADQAGSGLQFTWPTNRSPWPFVGIDHALVRDTTLVARSVDVIRVRGSDHAAVVVRYNG